MRWPVQSDELVPGEALDPIQNSSHVRRAVDEEREEHYSSAALSPLPPASPNNAGLALREQDPPASKEFPFKLYS